MLAKLVGLVMTGTVSLGLGGHVPEFIANLSESEQEALMDARETSVEVLSEEEVDFVESLEGKDMWDLTSEERKEVREINKALADATYEGIEDEELKEKMEEARDARHARREEAKANGERPRFKRDIEE